MRKLAPNNNRFFGVGKKMSLLLISLTTALTANANGKGGYGGPNHAQVAAMGGVSNITAKNLVDAVFVCALTGDKAKQIKPLAARVYEIVYGITPDIDKSVREVEKDRELYKEAYYQAVEQMLSEGKRAFRAGLTFRLHAPQTVLFGEPQGYYEGGIGGHRHLVLSIESYRDLSKVTVFGKGKNGNPGLQFEIQNAYLPSAEYDPTWGVVVSRPTDWIVQGAKFVVEPDAVLEFYNVLKTDIKTPIAVPMEEYGNCLNHQIQEAQTK